MNNKKTLLVIAALIILGGIGYFIFQQKSEPKQPEIIEKTALDPKNCTYVIEEENITLKDGYAEEEVAQDFASKIVTQYFGNEVKGDFNGDSLPDVAFILTQEPGGTGVFFYAAVALGSDDGCKGINAVFLGDRIAPQTTEFRNGEIIVNYAERKPDEPFAADPSVGVSKYLKIQNGNLVEIIK